MQFVGISDPLLEVIIHWLKGARHITPTWEIVVSVLQNPNINEAQLAEKIQRFYLHTHEEKTKSDQRSADSGTLHSMILAHYNGHLPHNSVF